MAAKSVELREQRMTVVKNLRELTDKADAEKRDLTAEEQGQWDRGMVDVDKLEKRYTDLERFEAVERSANEDGERRSKPLESRSGERTGPDVAKSRADFRHYLSTGELRGAMTPGQGETRDTVITTASKGGFLILPVEISADIVKPINDMVYIRGVCEKAGSLTKVKEAQKLGIRLRTTRMADADWTTEVQAVTEDTTGAYGRRDLEPQQVSKLAKISLRTLALSVDAEKEVNNELAYKFAITEEKAYMIGSGTGQPLGIFTASANGLPASQDVATATAGVLAADDLINVKYSLKQGHQNDPATRWFLSREAVKRIRKLKVASTVGGNDLEYVWAPGLVSGQPDKILDIPYCQSEYVPNTFATGLYVAALMNLRYYRIAELDVVFMQRLVELYAATGEVGFIGRRWLDAAVVLAEAGARLKLA
jgi:HK97 family phage major capsid protein